MKTWIFRILTVLGPPFAVMLAISVLAPNDESPQPFWDVIFIFILSSLMISIPQIVWALFCFAKLHSREKYWGGLIAAQAWLLAFGMWEIIEARLDPAGDDIWFLYFLPCIMLIPIGAIFGSLVRKIRLKEAA